MAFAEISFLYVFLPLCLLSYYITKNPKARNAVLIVFSLIFYAWGNPVGVFFILGSTVINYLAAVLCEKFEGKPFAKFTVTFTVIINIIGLAIPKYTAFVTENINAIFKTDIEIPKMIVPIGISYYTFRAISYIVDAYWGKVKVQKNFAQFLMYMSLFPHIIAGPIVRYSTVESQMAVRNIDYKSLSDGITRVITGLAKKVIIANNLYVIVEDFFGSATTQVVISSRTVADTWYAVFVYALFMYFDFSGYSDMAIGIAKLFGFDFDENFNYPFMCRTITEFWQRWHISLGTFFRDYLLYLPIFGKRRPYASLFLVWLSTGIWHGASWNYIIWGLYFGLFIFIERLITKKRLKKIPDVIMHIYTKLVIVIGFGIFYFTKFSQLGDFLKNLVGLNSNRLADIYVKSSITNNIWLIVAAVVFCFPVVPKIKKFCEKRESTTAVYSVCETAINIALLIVCTIFLTLQTRNPFFYANF